MSLTAFGQRYTDSITISRDQQRQCIKWYGEIQVLRDSILPAKDSIISQQQAFIVRTEERLHEISTNIAEKDRKLLRTRKIAFGVSGVGVIGWLLFFIFK